MLVAEGRMQLLKINLRELPLSEDLTGECLKELAGRMDGYSGADITNVCRDAAMMGIRRAIVGLRPEEIRALDKRELQKPVTGQDLNDALAKIHKSVGSADIEKYEKWMKEFGST